MNPHSYRNADRAWLAIMSLLLSAFSCLMLVLTIGVSLFRSTLFYERMCFFALAWHINEDGITVILLVPIYLTLLLALLFAFMSRRHSGNSRVVVASCVLALVLFVLSLVALPFLLFLTSACFG